MPLTSCNLLSLRAVFTSGNKKKLAGIRSSELDGWVICTMLWFTREDFTVMVEWARTLFFKRDQQLFSQNCGLTLEIPFNNLSSICTYNSLFTVFPSGTSFLCITTCLWKKYQHCFGRQCLQAKHIGSQWWFYFPAACSDILFQGCTDTPKTNLKVLCHDCVLWNKHVCEIGLHFCKQFQPLLVLL